MAEKFEDVIKEIEELRMSVKELSDKINELAESVVATIDVQKSILEVIRKEDENMTETHRDAEKELADATDDVDTEAKGVPEPEGDEEKHEVEDDVVEKSETPAPPVEVRPKDSADGMDEFAKAIAKLIRKEITVDEYVRIL